MAEPAGARVTLAELLAVLSLATDLGMGQPMEHVLRQCLIALRLAGRLGLAEADRAVVYYSALVAWVGCHVDAYEQATWFGDDTALKSDFRRTDFATATSRPLFMLRHLSAGRPVAERARLGVTFLGEGRKAAAAMLDNHWMAADNLAARLGLPQRVRAAVEQTFERWDGKGVPKGARGEEVLLAARLVALADVVEVFHRAGGLDAAIEVARQRRGTQFDPAIVDLFTAEARALCAGLEDTGTWDAVLAAEPAGGAALGDEQVEAALEAIADFTDVNRPTRSGTPAASRISPGRPRARSGWAKRPPGGSGGRAWSTIWPAGRPEHHLGQARPAQPRRARAGAPASVPHRAHAGLLGRPGPAGRHRGPAP